MSISINEYSGKHACRRGNSILIVFILSIKNIFIVDDKVKSWYILATLYSFYSQVENVGEKTIFSGHLHNQWPFVP